MKALRVAVAVATLSASLLLAGASPVAASCGSASVTFYKNANFGTPSKTFCFPTNVTNFSSYTWSDGSSFNDSASSFKFTADGVNNYFLKIYVDADYKGLLMYSCFATCSAAQMSPNDAASSYRFGCSRQICG